MRIRLIPKIWSLWKSPKRYRVAYGGRGSGKSYGVATCVILKAIQEPCRILCTKETQNTLSDSALAIMKRVIHDYRLDDAFTQTKHGLSCANGSEFIFRGLQYPDRIKSLDAIKYCWVEEATKVSQDAWDILIPTIREPGSEIWVTFNPDELADPTYQMFVAKGREDAEVCQVNYTDNRYFPAPLQHEMEWDKSNDDDKYRHVWLGEPRVISDAQVFNKKFSVCPFTTPDDVEVFYFGADWGFSQDPTALVRCFIRSDVLWIDHEAYGVGVDIDELPQLFDAVPESRKWGIKGDSERPDTMSYLRKQGFKVNGAKKGKGSVEEGIAFIRSFKHVVIHEKCKHVADEFRLYSYKRDKLTNEILPVLEDKHNHCVDALRYALDGVRRGMGSVANFSASELGL